MSLTRSGEINTRGIIAVGRDVCRHTWAEQNSIARYCPGAIRRGPDPVAVDAIAADCDRPRGPDHFAASALRFVTA